MRPILAAVVLIGLLVGFAYAKDKSAPPVTDFSMVGPEYDARLAKLEDAQPRRSGILTYYPNNGGGYTFKEDGEMAFYAMPFLPTTCHFARTTFVVAKVNGRQTARPIVETVQAFTIGKSKVPFGGQILYRGRTIEVEAGLRRIDTPLAKWSRDTPDGQFRLSIMAEDSETRLKLKSIVPVLEKASTAHESKL
jgi:hypothetical protein